MSDATENETTHAAAPVMETVAITLASRLAARYRALVETGLYASFDEAVGEAMRGHVRDAIEAAHHVVTLRLPEDAPPKRKTNAVLVIFVKLRAFFPSGRLKRAPGRPDFLTSFNEWSVCS